MSKKKSNLLKTDGKLSLRLTTLIVIALALVLVTLFYFISTRDTALPDTEPPPTEPIENDQLQEIGVELTAEGFTSPVAYVSPDDGTGRMFLVDQVGLIWIVDADGNVLEESFLDIQEELVDLTPDFDERGLLGLTFHPNFKENGRFFV